MKKCNCEKCEEKSCKLCWILSIIGAVVVIAGIAYAIYRYCTPDYLDDFDEEAEDEDSEEENYVQETIKLPTDDAEA